MKTIDLESVSANSTLSKQFSFDVFNKFSSLSTCDLSSDNIEDVYGTLIQCTEEVALETLPKKEKKSQIKPSNSPSVLEARSHLKAISLSYHRFPSTAQKSSLSAPRRILMMHILMRKLIISTVKLKSYQMSTSVNSTTSNGKQLKIFLVKIQNLLFE
jgi:hypothetical protein